MTTDAGKAYIRAVKILSASDNTPIMLYKKLCEKGFTEEDAASAVNRLIGEKLLDEKKLLEKTVTSLYEKRYGPAYIRAALRKKLFSKGSLTEAERIMSGLDFDSAKQSLTQELYLSGADEKKTAAALIRRGFVPEDV
jgi:SOS response regulatory protein OraA/RecX